MKRFERYIHIFSSWIRKKENFLLSLFFLTILGILLINTFHESYPDEFDNILGGWDIKNGILIYKDFFTHHGPVAYFIAALITLFSGNSFVLFRVIFALCIFAYLVWSYIYLRRKFGFQNSLFYLISIFIIALAGNYYWLHMLLADSLSAYFLAPVLAVLLLSTVTQSVLTRRDILIISLLTSFTVLSSLTFLYASFLIYGYSLYYFVVSNNIKLYSRRVFEAGAIFLAPYLVFLIYLIATFSLKDYLYQGFTFNQRYYIYNYPRPEGSTSVNPVRFAVVIANNFYNSYFTLLQQVKDLNLGFPLNITLAIGTISTVIYFFVRKYYAFSLFLLGFLIYSNARSDPLTSKETDYQSAVYIIIAFVVIPFLLINLYKVLNNETKLGKNILPAVGFFIIGLYAVFSSMFLFQKFFNRTYEKYMGNAPLIYDHPEIAPIINRVVRNDETVWIGPFEFKELFYTKAKPASRYQIFIPGMGFAPEIRDSFIQELENSKPPVIYFQKNFSILGRSPEMYGQFFLTYLDNKYVLLMDYEKNGITYKSNLQVTEKTDLEGRLYIRKERADEIIQRLLEQGFIRENNELTLHE